MKNKQKNISHPMDFSWSAMWVLGVFPIPLKLRPRPRPRSRSVRNEKRKSDPDPDPDSNFIGPTIRARAEPNQKSRVTTIWNENSCSSRFHGWETQIFGGSDQICVLDPEKDRSTAAQSDRRSGSGSGSRSRFHGDWEHASAKSITSKLGLGPL